MARLIAAKLGSTPTMPAATMAMVRERTLDLLLVQDCGDCLDGRAGDGGCGVDSRAAHK